MKFISLFSGIGGFDIGFEQAGIRCLTQVEIDKYCIGVLNKHWPDVIKYKDIKDVGKQQLPSVDVICGGFPCQGLSVAGQRGGLADPRSGLWYEFARIIQETRTKWIVIENVPGLLSSNERRDFAIILEALDEWGYGVAWRRLDSQFYRLAQRRPRIFFVGCLGDIRSAAKVLFESESLSWNTAPSREKGKISPPLTTTGVGAGRTGNERNELDFCIPTLAGSITTREGQRHKLDQDTYIINSRQDPIHEKNLSLSLGAKDRGHAIVFQQNTRDEVRKIGGNGKIAGSLSAKPGMKQQNYLYQWSSGGGDEPKDTAQALRSTAEHNYQFMHTNLGIRRLTPLECERLQGFPDDWTQGHSDTQRYKMLGNAVSVPVAFWIGNRIMQLNEQIKDD